MRTPRFAPALACAALCVWPGTSAFADGTDCACTPAPVAAPVVRKPVVRSAPKPAPQTVVNVTNQYITPPPPPIQVVATQTYSPMVTAVGTPIVASSLVAPVAQTPAVVTTTSVYPQNYGGATVTTATGYAPQPAAYAPAPAYAPVMAAPMVVAPTLTPVAIYPTQPTYQPVSVYPQQEPSYYDRTPRVGEVLPPFYVRSRAMESWNDGNGQTQQAPAGQAFVQSGFDMLLANVATGVITQVILGGLRGGFGGGPRINNTQTVTYNRTVNTNYGPRPMPPTCSPRC